MYSEITEQLNIRVESILNNPKYKSSRKKLFRVVETWKNYLSSEIEKTEDKYDKLVLRAFMCSLNHHIYELSYDDSIKFIQNVLKTMKGVDEK